MGLRTHGLSNRIPEYVIWKAMRQRCLNPNTVGFHHYGGRGIAIAKEWDDFGCFYADMGCRPSSRHTIERINNDGPYSKANCRWATYKEQMHNTGRNVRLTLNGITKTVTAWAEYLALSNKLIFRRLEKGWPIERTLTEPVHTEKRKHRHG